jgi:hypothetical protein
MPYYHPVSNEAGITQTNIMSTKTVVTVISTREQNPVHRLSPKMGSIRDSGDRDYVWIGADPYKHDAPHNQYWLVVPQILSYTPQRDGLERTLNHLASHTAAVAAVVAQATQDILAGDYLVDGIGNPFPLHVSNIPEVADAIKNMA